METCLKHVLIIYHSYDAQSMNPEAFLIVRKMMNCFDIYVNLFIDFFNEGIKNEFHILIHFETENNSGMNQVILARDCKTKLRLL